MPLTNAGPGPERASGPGPWFTAQLEGNCSRCGEDIEPGDQIRADGFGSWECCEDDEAGISPDGSAFTETDTDDAEVRAERARTQWLAEKDYL